MKSCLEVRKGFKPLCIELITTAKICDIECPYRHWLSGKDSTSVPEYGFVNMKLLEVLAPNHYSVQVNDNNKISTTINYPVHAFLRLLATNEK